MMEKILIGIVILILLLPFIFIKYEKDHPCLHSHEEKYYDSTGTSLWLSTKNPGMLALNGYKTRTVCDLRKYHLTRYFKRYILKIISNLKEQPMNAIKSDLLAVARTLAFVKLTEEQEEKMLSLLLERAEQYKKLKEVRS